MSMIKIDNLTFAYPGSYDNVFENVSVQIDTDWKLGLVGRNGRGKTTLLSLLQGKYEYSGKIITDTIFDYFPYQIEDKARLTYDIATQVCPSAEEWEIYRELSYLEVDADVLFRPFTTLSEGEQTKVLLAALFLNKGHFLLIDEPTNHLDTKTRQLLSSYLRRKRGFILVSHDRCFLDGCIDHILSINRNDIQVQAGNFSSWLTNFERQQMFEQSQNDRLQKDILRLQQAAKRTSAWSDKIEKSKSGKNANADFMDRGYIGHQSAKMMKRAKSAEHRQQRAIEEKSKLLKNTETAQMLKLSPLNYRTERMIDFNSVSVIYDGKEVFEPVTFSLNRGDRMVIDGKNGCGKSSILKLITRQGIEHTGTVKISSGIIISYVPQNASDLKGNLSDYAMENGIDESLFKAILRKMDFERVQFEKDMCDFSAGQKKKVLIARSLCQKAHLYIWDEPLNYIDIYSRIQIENLIAEFEPTMIFVEHDKAFQDKIATKTLSL